MILRPITPADLPRMLEIETLAPRTAQWAEESYRKIAEGELSLAGNVAEIGAEVTGFLIYRSLGADEIEILNLAVAIEHRRKGFGRALVSQLPSQTAGSVFLDARASNAAAIGFYRRLGFSEIGPREGYYGNPREDAVRMGFQRKQGLGSGPQRRRKSQLKSF